tara:strand:- start:1125 stop:1805 length:681 start_codon:yes stop_codon:yes gene_type:complete
MKLLNYIVNKYKINLNKKHLPIEIPNTNRITLAELFSELNFKIGAEIGVERGVYSKILCQKNPGLKLYGIDPWKAYRGYREHVSQQKLDRFVEETKERMIDYEEYSIIRKFSVDAAKLFKNESLDFVYIDANHEFRHTVDDISEWYRKIRVGGIISGHDYIKRKDPRYLMGVVEAVTGFTDAYHIKPYFVLGEKNPQEGHLRDTARSWFWVKPPTKEYKSNKEMEY